MMNNDDLITCENCNEKFPEDEIINWDDQLCDECTNQQGIDRLESRMDLD